MWWRNKCTLTHALSLTHSLTHSLPPSLPPSLTHSLPPSLRHSLTHSLTQPPTHVLTRSLTHLLIRVAGYRVGAGWFYLSIYLIYLFAIDITYFVNISLVESLKKGFYDNNFYGKDILMVGSKIYRWLILINGKQLVVKFSFSINFMILAMLLTLQHLKQGQIYWLIKKY